MGEDLINRWKGMKINDKKTIEVGVDLSKGKAANDKENIMLVGTLLTDRQYNRYALGQTMSSVWKWARKISFCMLQDNVCQFEFESKKDRDMVLRDRPWSFDKSLLVLKEYDGSTRPSNIIFYSTTLWICIIDLPWNMVTKEVGEAIGSTFIDCMEVDTSYKEGLKGSWLCIRVEVDITALLKRGIFLKMSATRSLSGSNLNMRNWLIFVIVADYSVILRDDCEMGEFNNNETEEYGDWLRAESSMLIPQHLIITNIRADTSNNGGERIGTELLDQEGVVKDSAIISTGVIQSATTVAPRL